MRGDATGTHQQFEDNQRAMFAASSRVELNGNTVALRLNPAEKTASHRPAFATWVRENAGTGFEIGETRGNQLVVTIEGAGNDPREVFRDMKTSLAASRQRLHTAPSETTHAATRDHARPATRPTPAHQRVDVDGPFAAREKAMFDSATGVERNGHWVSLRFKEGVEPTEYAGTFNSWMRVHAGAGFEVKPAVPVNGQGGLKVMISGASNDPKAVHAGLKSRIKLPRPGAQFAQLNPQKPNPSRGQVAANEGELQMAASQPNDANAPGSQPTSRPIAFQQS